MIEIAFLVSYISSPYPFELRQGLTTEMVAGSSFNDHEDRPSANAGLRLTYLNPDERDTIITAEIQALSQTVFTGVTYKTPRYKFLGDLNLAIYEIYLPYAFRLVGGPCIEWRTSKVSYGANYRAGLGYYLNSFVGVFTDLGGRYLARNTKTSLPYDFSMSLQFIF